MNWKRDLWRDSLMALIILTILLQIICIIAVSNQNSGTIQVPAKSVCYIEKGVKVCYWNEPEGLYV